MYIIDNSNKQAVIVNDLSDDFEVNNPKIWKTHQVL